MVTVALIGSFGCGERPVKSEGEACFASSECGPGLVCDLAADPALCRPMGSGPGPQPDAGSGPIADAAPGTPDGSPPQPDAAPVDAAPL